MFTTLEIFLIVFTGLYIADIIWLYTGLLRCMPKHKPVKEENATFVSVVVAARNEEANILPCLESLSRLDYPTCKLEIFIVDDRSTDKTPAIISSFVERFPHIKLIQVVQEGTTIKGKANALAFALEKAKGELFMFTDADCKVSPEWVRTTVENFSKEVGIIGSYTVLEAHTVFEGIQALDWLLHFSVSAAMAGHNVPITVIGNNFSISREAYNKVGGFRGIPFSVTEDYAMVQAVLTKTPYKVKFLLTNDTMVESYACETWKQIYRQKQRWGVGALDMVSHGIIVIGIGYVTHVLLLFGFFFASLNLVAILFGLKFIIDWMILWKPLSIFRKRVMLRYFFQFEFYYYFYGIVFPFVALFTRKVTWKERKF